MSLCLFRAKGAVTGARTTRGASRNASAHKRGVHTEKLGAGVDKLSEKERAIENQAVREHEERVRKRLQLEELQRLQKEEERLNRSYSRPHILKKNTDERDLEGIRKHVDLLKEELHGSHK